MKKLLLVFAVLFASCFEIQVKPREVNAQAVSGGLVFYNYSEKVINGLNFGICTEGDQIFLSCIIIFIYLVCLLFFSSLPIDGNSYELY